MKKFYTLTAALFLILIAIVQVQAQTVTILLRPSFVDTSAVESRGAVLVNLSNYPTDDVRYRLYNGSNQYNCWDQASGTYITATSYAAGPRAPGTPTTSSSFWIIYARGSNNNSIANYRDRLGPAYSPDNYKTQALPVAKGITNPFDISGTLLAAPSLPLTAKYVTLAFNNDVLISASHSDLTTGTFGIVCPDGSTITKVQVRTVTNEIIGEKTGSWSSSTDIGSIQLIASVIVDLSDLKVDGTTLADFAPAKTLYLVNLPAGTTTVPTVTATAADAQASLAITPATNLTGDKAARTTSIVVTGSDGTTKKTYTVQFDPILAFNNIADLRGATDYTRLHRLTTQAILTAQKFESSRNTYYIQDNSAAIRIDDPSKVITTIYEVGDGITGLTGTFSTYGGMLQFVPADDPGPKTASGVALPAAIVTVADLKANFNNYEAELILLEDITFGITGTFSTAVTNYIVSQGTETITLRTEFPSDLDGKQIPTIANVRGIAIIFNSTVQIAPRFYSDFMTATDIHLPADGGIRLYPVPAKEMLTIEGVDAFTGIEIRNIAGKVVHSASNNGEFMRTVETSQLPAGIYFIRLTSPAGTITKKFVKN